MMLKEDIKKLEASSKFKEFIKENPDYYLAHCFTMFDAEEDKYEWQFGYYSPKKDDLVVFEMGEEITLKEQNEVFKKESTVNKLDLDDLKVTLTRALGICDDMLKEKYPRQVLTKKIIIAQNLEKPLYNITLITNTLSIINIKIDAGSGEVMSDSIQSIMGLGKWEKGEKERPAG